MTIASDDNIQTIIDNLTSMLSTSSPTQPSHNTHHSPPAPIHQQRTQPLKQIDLFEEIKKPRPKADITKEPGDYLQWVERDWLSHFPPPSQITSADDANTQLTGYLKKLWPKTKSVRPLLPTPSPPHSPFH
jgi:hypothetical protein